MIVQPDEMNTVVEQYKLDDITDNTTEITATCLRAAESRVLSYLSSKYDIEKILELPTSSPALADIKEIIKDIALYYILRRANIDIAYDSVRESYKLHNEYLHNIATSNIGIVGLPVIRDKEGKPLTHLTIISKPKIDHDF